MLSNSLRAWFRQHAPVAIALSAGVDSSVLAALAHQEIGDQVIALTGVSDSLGDADLQEIIAFCKKFDIQHHLVETQELSLPQYQQNAPNRCFFCKQELYSRIDSYLKTHLGHLHFTLVDGTHTDDLKSHRPGHLAATKANVFSPYLSLKLTKKDIRHIAAELNLSNAHKPASPCLSSRVAYGLNITPDRLQRIGEAETLLRQLGLQNVRVRLHHDNIARIEVPSSDFHVLCQHRQQIIQSFKLMGFTYTTLDLGGFRSGSLLEVLKT